MNRLGGWWRLWILASLVLGPLPAIIAFENNYLEWEFSIPFAEDPSKQQQQDFEARLAESTRRCIFFDQDRFQGIVSDSGETVTIQGTCFTLRTVNAAIGAFLLPSLIMLVFGLGFAWVRDGFRGREY